MRNYLGRRVYHSWAGPELMAHGNRDSGQTVIRRGIALLRTWSAGGADSMEVHRRAGLALLLYYAGDWDGCSAAWGNLERPRFLVEAPCPPWILAARHGDRAQADRLLAAYDSSVRSATPTVRIWAVVAHARVAAILGDRDQAVAYLSQAVPTLGFEDMSIVPHIDIDFESLWAYPPLLELMRPKD